MRILERNWRQGIVWRIGLWRIRGQTITDSTFREVASHIAKLDRPTAVSQRRVTVSQSADVLILEAADRP